MSRKTKLKKNCLCQRYICFINKVWFNYSVPVPYQNCGCKQFIIVVDGYPGVIMRCCHVISCVLQPPFGPPRISSHAAAGTAPVSHPRHTLLIGCKKKTSSRHFPLQIRSNRIYFYKYPTIINRTLLIETRTENA